MIASDRQHFISLKAGEAQHAAVMGNKRQSFQIVRQLAGMSCALQARSMKKRDGSFTASESERQERWQEHFADVFQGEI
eukprot:7084718-Karenia_brevis.AAC.1